LSTLHSFDCAKSCTGQEGPSIAGSSYVLLHLVLSGTWYGFYHLGTWYGGTVVFHNRIIRAQAMQAKSNFNILVILVVDASLELA